jgi:hypothetical protein
MGAITHHTWGITPGAFLAMYAIGFLATLAWSELRRHRILREALTDHVPDIRDLDPCELALLTHGERDARTVALLNLERLDVVQIENASAGSIALAVPDHDAAVSKRDARRQQQEWVERMQGEAELAPRATTVATNCSCDGTGSCRLEVGLTELVRTRGEVKLETIETDAAVDECTRALRRDLVDREYLLDENTIARLKWLRIVWVPLFALGLVRLAAKVSDHQHVGLLVLALIGTAAFVFGRDIPEVSPAVRKQLKVAEAGVSRDDVERAFSADAPPRSTDDMTGLALLGPALLWSAASPYAVSLAVPYPTSSSGWGCAGCGGCGCGGCGCA